MIGLWVSRSVFGLCFSVVVIAYALPSVLFDLGYDISSLKWATVVYGMFALMGLCVVTPIWLIVELSFRRKQKVGRHV